MPSFCKTRWVYNGRIVSYVNSNYEGLIRVFEEFELLHNKNKKELNLIKYIKEELILEETRRNLSILDEFFLIINYLYNIFQSSKINHITLTAHFEKSINGFRLLREKFKSEKKVNRVIKKIEKELNYRFESYMGLDFLKVFSLSHSELTLNNIRRYINTLPSFEEFEDKKSLSIQLHTVLNYISLNKVDSAHDVFFSDKKEKLIPSGYSQLKDFINYIITLSSNSSSAERGFSILSTIKTKIRNSLGDQKTNNLLRISTEKDLTHKYMNSQELLKVFLKKFAEKKRFLDFGNFK